jgi:hypothetical protein
VSTRRLFLTEHLRLTLRLAQGFCLLERLNGAFLGGELLACAYDWPGRCELAALGRR